MAGRKTMMHNMVVGPTGNGAIQKPSMALARQDFRQMRDLALAIWRNNEGCVEKEGTQVLTALLGSQVFFFRHWLADFPSASILPQDCGSTKCHNAAMPEHCPRLVIVMMYLHCNG